MEKFNLMIILRIALKNIKILILTGIVFAAMAFGYCKFVATPRYTAIGSVIVTNGGIFGSGGNSNNSTLNNSDIAASINIVKTVEDILKTPEIYIEMSEALNGKYSYSQLANMTSIGQREDVSMFIDISFTATDTNESITLVNEFLKLIPEYVNIYIPNSEVAVSKAYSSAKVFPKTNTYIVGAALVGMIAVFCIILLINLSNTVINGKDDFSERFDIPVLGDIPNFEKSRTKKNNYYSYSDKGVGY